MIQVNDLIGMPYTKQHDCNWLTAIMAERYNRGFPEGLETPEDPEDWPDMFRKILMDHYRKVETPTEGDIAIFEIPVGKKTGWHCGTVIKPGWMITTRQTVGVHLTRLNSILWKICLEGYYEYAS